MKFMEPFWSLILIAKLSHKKSCCGGNKIETPLVVKFIVIFKVKTFNKFKMFIKNIKFINF